MAMQAVETRRFGGAIPAGADRLLAAPAALDETRLYFSHGRAALRWIVAERGPFAGALVCAYTWPTVPDLLQSLGLEVRLFDVGDPHPERLLPAGSSRWLVLVPLLFGLDPWLDADALARSLGSRALMLIDGAQTAFTALDRAPPPGGAVLSCPHKCTALGDGGILAVDPPPSAEERRALAGRPVATESSAARLEARELFARGDAASEAKALERLAVAESSWPLAICRMTDRAKADLARLDRPAHAARRRENRARLRQDLEGAAPLAWDGDGVPFCHAILAPDRAGLLARLRARNVFATPLWPDTRHDPAQHPRAARLAQQLVGLPVDQRYGADDMDALSELVTRAL